MKFRRCSSIQTTGIEHSFPKLNILQVERTRRKKKEETNRRGRNTSKVRCVSGDGVVDTVVTEFVTSYPPSPQFSPSRFASYQFYSITRQDTDCVACPQLGTIERKSPPLHLNELYTHHVIRPGSRDGLSLALRILQQYYYIR
jgi:hypothetical protein